MKVHQLKCWPSPFSAMRRGDKVHEIRVNDRDYMQGDILHLREWIPEQRTIGGGRVDGRYTGDELIVRVTYLTPGGEWGLPKELCVMSVKVLAWEITR